MLELQFMSKLKCEEKQYLIEQIYNYVVKHFSKNELVDSRHYFGIKGKSGVNKFWLVIKNNDEIVIKFRKNAFDKSLGENINEIAINSFEDFLEFFSHQEMVSKHSVKNDIKKVLNSYDDNLNNDSDNVRIYSIGSCDAINREGSYTTIMDYKGKEKIISGNLTDTTANRCILQGIIEALKALKPTFHSRVTVVTSTKIGIEAGKRNRGPNLDLVQEIYRLVEEKQIVTDYRVIDGQHMKKRIGDAKKNV